MDKHLIFMEVVIHETVNVVQPHTLAEKKQIARLIGQERDELFVDVEENIILALKGQDIRGKDHFSDGREGCSYGEILIVGKAE